MSHGATSPEPAGRGWLRPMRSRDPHEPHRVATPLELLFDLCFVVAVAQLSARMHHGLAAGHTGQALLAYGTVFFAIWWAWMNFTWFASAYDTDDVPYRLAALVQIAGVLILAAGVPRGFDQQDFRIITFGYAVMRVALVAQWLRAARGDPARRRTTLRFAAGVSACMAGWIGLLALPAGWWLAGWPVLVAAELLVPIWAERPAPTAWNAHHIAERYGLLTLIVLGESVLSATIAIQVALDAGGASARLFAVVGGAPLIIFSMWWLYFDHPAHRFLVSNRIGFFWGYGHLLIFSAAAAVGAGLAVAVDQATGSAAISDWAAGAAVAIPVALYLVSVWAMHVRPHRGGRLRSAAYPVAAVLVLAAAAAAWAILLAGAILAGLVAVSIVTDPQRRPG